MILEVGENISWKEKNTFTHSLSRAESLRLNNEYVECQGTTYPKITGKLKINVRHDFGIECAIVRTNRRCSNGDSGHATSELRGVRKQHLTEATELTALSRKIGKLSFTI